MVVVQNKTRLCNLNILALRLLLGNVLQRVEGYYHYILFIHPKLTQFSTIGECPTVACGTLNSFSKQITALQVISIRFLITFATSLLLMYKLYQQYILWIHSMKLKFEKLDKN